MGGFLYNWYAVNTAKICPNGWHVPSETEWTELVNFLGGESVAGGKTKTTGTIEAGNGLWYQPNVDATNETGFSALPEVTVEVFSMILIGVEYGGHQQNTLLILLIIFILIIMMGLLEILRKGWRSLQGLQFAV